MKYSFIFQGLFNINFLKNIEKYLQYGECIVSTWNSQRHLFEPTIKKFGNNIKFVFSEDLENSDLEKQGIYNSYNIYRQTVTTYKGIEISSGEYVVKFRTDETFDNVDYIISNLNENTLVSLDLFFRPPDYILYHISDHLFGTKRTILLNAFYKLKNALENNKIELKNGTIKDLNETANKSDALKLRKFTLIPEVFITAFILDEYDNGILFSKRDCIEKYKKYVKILSFMDFKNIVITTTLDNGQKRYFIDNYLKHFLNFDRVTLEDFINANLYDDKTARPVFYFTETAQSMHFLLNVYKMTKVDIFNYPRLKIVDVKPEILNQYKEYYIPTKSDLIYRTQNKII